MTKPKCLRYILDNRSLRAYGRAATRNFLRAFPWFSFLTQAPQALYSLTGYGLIFGSLMGFATDLFWGVVRAPVSGAPRIILPPADDVLGKAARYLTTPPWHWFNAAALSYEDHWLLLLADVMATQVVMQHFAAGFLDDRLEVLAGAPVIEFEPWHPATRSVLGDLGVDVQGAYDLPMGGLSPVPTYGEVLGRIGERFELTLREMQQDFPRVFSAQGFAWLLSTAGQDVWDWFDGGSSGFAPIFEPEELAFARLFEFGIFPPEPVEAELIELFLQRSLAIARAAGREFPGRSELMIAANEVWGGFVTA